MTIKKYYREATKRYRPPIDSMAEEKAKREAYYRGEKQEIRPRWAIALEDLMRIAYSYAPVYVSLPEKIPEIKYEIQKPNRNSGAI